MPEELRKSSVCISCKGHEFLLAGRSYAGHRPGPGRPAARRSSRPSSFSKVGQAQPRLQPRGSAVRACRAAGGGDLDARTPPASCASPIGRTGATKLQYLAIGKGTCQHALIAGKTGSGKSTLFHVIITNLALWCSPEQVEFYLVDFKKGVEFKCYATHRLPHARVVAIESDREFGLSVLQRVDDELKRRGDLFRKLGRAGHRRLQAGGRHRAGAPRRC